MMIVCFPKEMVFQEESFITVKVKRGQRNMLNVLFQIFRYVLMQFCLETTYKNKKVIKLEFLSRAYHEIMSNWTCLGLQTNFGQVQN